MNKDSQKNIYSKILKAANETHKYKGKVGGDWIVFDIPKKHTILKIKEWLKEKKKRKFKVSFERTLVSDLEAYQNFDAELELTALLTEEILKAERDEQRKKGL